MRNCTQSRPADHNSKSAAKPIQAPQSYSSSAAYLGSGAPSSMYLGVPPYGSSLFNGTSLPPYDLRFSGGSGYHYDYGSRLSAGSPYGPLHLSGPSPYSSGSMLGSGGMYGMPPLMDRYGLGLPMGHAMVCMQLLVSLTLQWLHELLLYGCLLELLPIWFFFLLFYSFF
uniref:Uncharacterized protein n=1 Tax=Nelumbo nucifera TaxID=4432 RepID=A0A822Z1R2_NELNU|nr:TPA_asm: hypothetical protein HUJ06_013029 [Nelumbo nucifera]